MVYDYISMIYNGIENEKNIGLRRLRDHIIDFLSTF